ncbi:radical SAM protein [Nanoarchaeota archaeon]
MKADIKLGYACNNNCLHCVISGQKKDAQKAYGKYDRTTEEFKKELDSAKAKGCDLIVLTGGEPTIRKDIVEIIRYATKIGMKAGMQTNGRAFSIDKFAWMFKDLDVKSYTIALHGPREVHERITRAKNSFDQTVKGIKNLIRMGKRVNGKIVLSKINMEYLTDIFKIFESLGVKRGNVAFPHAQGNAWDNFHEVVPKYSELKKHLDKAIKYLDETGMKYDFEAIPPCIIEREELCADLGKEGALMNQFDGKGERSWTEVRQQAKKKFVECGDCKYDAVCEGVWQEYPAKYGDKEFVAQ